MTPIAAALLLSLAAQDKPSAQDGLTPTDVLDGGRFTATLRFAAFMTSGEATIDPVVDADLDAKQYRIQLEAAAGLGHGFEVEAVLPFELEGSTEIEDDLFELEQERRGVGDLSLGVNYRIVEDTVATPNVLVGVFIVLPTGDNDAATPETTFLGFQTSNGEEGGIGDGAFKYGLQAGLSHEFAGAEPYFLIRYLFPWDGEQEGDEDIDIESDGHFTFIAGVEIEATDAVTIDLRASLELEGERVLEDETGDETTEESFMQYGFQGRVYGSVSPNVALFGGIGVLITGDHETIEELNLESQDVLSWGFEFGIHIVFGH